MRRFSIALLGVVFATACGGPARSTAGSTTPPPATSAAEPAPAPAAAAAPAAQCPANLIDSAEGQGGSCFEPAVLGAGVVAACGDALVAKGWVHDTDAEAAIGGKTGKTLACYHAK